MCLAKKEVKTATHDFLRYIPRSIMRHDSMPDCIITCGGGLSFYMIQVIFSPFHFTDLQISEIAQRQSHEV